MWAAEAACRANRHPHTGRASFRETEKYTCPDMGPHVTYQDLMLSQ